MFHKASSCHFSLLYLHCMLFTQSINFCSDCGYFGFCPMDPTR